MTPHELCEFKTKNFFLHQSDDNESNLFIHDRLSANNQSQLWKQFLLFERDKKSCGVWWIFLLFINKNHNNWRLMNDIKTKVDKNYYYFLKNEFYYWLWRSVKIRKQLILKKWCEIKQHPLRLFFHVDIRTAKSLLSL